MSLISYVGGGVKQRHKWNSKFPFSPLVTKFICFGIMNYSFNKSEKIQSIYKECNYLIKHYLPKILINNVYGIVDRKMISLG